MGQRRHLARRLALQVLYSCEYHPITPQETLDRLAETEHISRKNWNTFCQTLTSLTIENREELEVGIQTALTNWRVERLSMVDRILLRLALCEMRHFDDIPIKVTLNEYIELAKEFSTDDSSSFINGILDKLAKTGIK